MLTMGLVGGRLNWFVCGILEDTVECGLARWSWDFWIGFPMITGVIV